MTNIILVIVCLVIGLLLQRVKDFPSDTPKALNQFIIFISLPSLALIHIPRIELDLVWLYPIMTAWIVLFLGFGVILLMGRIFEWDRRTIGCLLLTTGFGNTSFVGFPVIEAIYGSDALQIALMVDQPGSFVAITTVGIIIASVYSSGKTRKRVILRRILLFPPFITFCLALLMKFAGIQAEGAALGVLERLGATITPLALISVGMQLKINMEGQRLSPLAGGLVYKLILAPLFLFLLYVVILGGEGLIVEVSIMEAAMAPMITGSVIAMTHGLNPRLATLVIGIGTPLSFLTLAFWYFFLGWAM